MKKSNIFILSVIILLLTNFSFSQNNAPLPLRFILPQAYTQIPYGIDGSDVVSVGPFDNYIVTPTQGFLEPDICVNPANPLNFVTTDNRIIPGGGGAVVYYTTDGGVTWLISGITTNSGDPAFSADSLGNFYLVTLNPPVSGFYLYKSVNGGVSWSSPLNISVGNGVDKEWIAADQTNGPFKNNVYIAYYNISGGAGVGFHRSVDNGATWTQISPNLGSGSANPGPDVAVDANGKVYVAWDNGGGTTIRTSVDGGSTFSSPVSANFHSEPGSIQFGRYCLKNAIRVNAMPHIAIDLTNGPYRNYVYCFYPTNPPGPDLADVFLTRSTDGGVTWNSGSPVKLNDDATFNDQWMGDVSVDNQGRVWATWNDSRNDPSNVLTEIYGAVSTDGGATFSPNFKVSNQNYDPNVIRISQGSGQAYYMGDYQGMSGKTITFPIYCNQNNVHLDYTAYLPDYGVSFSKLVDTVGVNSTSTNYVQIPMLGPYSGAVTYSATVSPSPAPGTITFNFLPGNVKTLVGHPDSLQLNSVVSALVPLGNYSITVTGTENSGPRTHTRSWTLTVGVPIGIHHNSNEIPRIFAMTQNYPNPFNPSTQFEYSIPKASVVSIKVYDVLGREVAAPVNNAIRAPGNYQVTFDASNLASGVYYYKITAGDFTDIKKMILIK